MTAQAMLKAGLLAGLPLLLAACEPGPKESVQTGFRGTGMVQINDRDNALPADKMPGETYADYVLDPNNLGPPATESYQNIQVLTDLSTEEFNRLMIAITEWVSPEQGCNYCHNPENMASDEVYTKVVARKMLQMNRAINVNWSNHVQKAGVTCYTCHRGQPVPAYYWTVDPDAKPMTTITGNTFGQNNPDKPAAHVSSLPYDPFTTYLQTRDPTERSIRVAGTSAYPPAGGGGATIAATEQTYSLMFHLSTALGVNCTFCHNAHSFGDWSTSTPQRAVSWYGIRMVRDVNQDYITPLTSVFPANRLGPDGDPFKVNCMTCHQGKNKPLGGQSMIGDFPELARLGKPPATAAPAETAAAQAPPAG